LNKGLFLNISRTGEPEAERIARELPERIAAAAPLRLSGGSPGRAADLEFRLQGSGLDRRVLVDVLDPVATGTELRTVAEKQQAIRTEVPDTLFLVASSILSEGIRGKLRSLGLNHADLSGTLYLDEPGLMVRVDGTPEPRPPASAVPRSTINPFADRASLVLRTLLREPGRAWGIREIAEVRGISPGLASMVATELVRRDYAEQGAAGLRLHDAAAALADWSAAVDWSRTRILGFQTPYSPAEMLADVVPSLAAGSGERVALTQLSALDRYAPHVQHPGTIHLYVDHTAWDRTVETVRARHYAEPSPGGGNLQLALPRAKRSTFFDLRTIDGLPVVSPVQLFLDLTGFPIRGREAAHMLLRTVLTRELRLTPEQVDHVARGLD
jgi:hypothetical protein